MNRTRVFSRRCSVHKPTGDPVLLITAKVNVISHDGPALRIGCDDVSILEECLSIKPRSCGVGNLMKSFLPKVQITEGTGARNTDFRLKHTAMEQDQRRT